MTGVPGAGGPVPKRSDERLGHTSKESRERVDGQAAATKPVIPDPNPEWHPIALMWFESLKSSGQSVFYQSADWSSAWVIAESMSREFKPQPLMIDRKNGEPPTYELVELPPKAASLAAWLKGFTALLATEGDRRRAALELQQPKPEESADVSSLADVRLRLAGSS